MFLLKIKASQDSEIFKNIPNKTVAWTVWPLEDILFEKNTFFAIKLFGV